jgi:parvulin-like peptidyl-prolyl isomerase
MSSKEAEAELRAAFWKHRLVWFAVACAVLLVAVIIRLCQGDSAASAAPAATATANSKSSENAPLPRPGRPQHDIMALVNGKDITRPQLTDACVKRYGKDVLESLVNKRLITKHCANRGIAVTNEEITEEIDRMAKRFKLGREQWLDLLQKERGVSPQEYARDIIWPTLALRKLADKQLQLSPAEVQQGYEQEFGDMVRARLIAVSDANKAKQLHDQLAAHPENFARAAIEHSEDVNSASVGGMIQPIRHHVGDDGIEQAAFSLKPGQVSQVIPVGQQFVILKCDERIPARNVPMAEVQGRIVERLKEEKLRTAASSIFAEVQKSATIQNVYNNPQLATTMPNVVATVNGDPITMQELGQECMLRHGDEVLESEISKLLLSQALDAAKLKVTDGEIEAEMRHAAELAGVVDQKGDADLAKWIKTVTDEQEVTKEQYIRDSVWPSAALKKLTAQEVKVSDEDIAKGFEANYGERVRCRAVVLANMRKAQEVWDKARRNTSPEYFGDLAEEYSVEPQSKALRGEVPPLGRHGGQPQLEDVAFQLAEGQLSGIIQVADKFVILRCEGRTKPEEMDLDQVRDILHRDIYEKKLRLAMSEKFEQINENARVDNYLAGTSHTPDAKKSAEQTPTRTDTAVRPTVAR